MRCLAAALVLLLALFGQPAEADISGLPEAARSSLETRAGELTAALLAGDPATMFDFIPPPIVARLAATAGRTPEEFRALFIENRPADTGVSEHLLDLAATKLFVGTDGATYALIPTESLAFDPYRGRFRVKSKTVGIRSGDTWHFMTVADQTVLTLLIGTYPSLADAPLTPAVLTPAP